MARRPVLGPAIARERLGVDYVAQDDLASTLRFKGPRDALLRCDSRE